MLGEDPIELGLKGHEQEFLATLRRDPVYQRLFPAAFPGESDAFSLSNVTKAIAAFERTIVSMRSPYDRYRWGGDSSAISDAAKRGELLFFSSERAGCFQCHGGLELQQRHSLRRRRERGPRRQHARRLFQYRRRRSMPHPIAASTSARSDPETSASFARPTLRNIALTAPYMHDGSLATLDEVIDHYAAGGKFSHPNKSPILRRFRLDGGRQARPDRIPQVAHRPRTAVGSPVEQPWPALKEPQ